MGSGQVALTWLDGSATTRVWVFSDAIVSDTATVVCEAPSNPVERGIATTDHIRPEPIELAFDVYISASPLSADGTTIRTLPITVPQPEGLTPDALINRGFTAAKIAKAPSQATSFDTTYPPEKDFVGEVYEILETLQGRRKDPPALISVAATARVWPGLYALTRWAPRRAREEGPGLSVSLEFKEIRIATVQVVPTPKPSALRATPKKSKGRQDPQPVPPERKKSFFKGLEKVAKRKSATPEALPDG